MGDVPRFVVAPTLRCQEPLEPGGWKVCGAPAVALRRGVGEMPAGYFCGEHARLGDQEIPPAYLFRRVSVTIDVLFAGASMLPGQAEHEAVERLRELVASAGGVINLHAASSAVGRYEAPAPPPRTKGGRGRAV